jgi:hypothetical protein
VSKNMAGDCTVVQTTTCCMHHYCIQTMDGCADLSDLQDASPRHSPDHTRRTPKPVQAA